MPTPGRPRILDKQKKSRILSLLRLGCGRLTAANAVNCHPRTILNTAKRDPEFADKLALAESAAELVHMENINNAGKDVKYWRASAWMLERIHPERFAKLNPGAVTPSQITNLIAQIADLIVQEVPAARSRKQILKRFDRILLEAHFYNDPIPYQNQDPLIDLKLAAPEKINDDPN
jgi:hypothetical protein